MCFSVIKVMSFPGMGEIWGDIFIKGYLFPDFRQKEGGQGAPSITAVFLIAFS